MVFEDLSFVAEIREEIGKVKQTGALPQVIEI
jgi:hypothetical protein